MQSRDALEKGPEHVCGPRVSLLPVIRLQQCSEASSGLWAGGAQRRLCPLALGGPSGPSALLFPPVFLYLQDRECSYQQSSLRGTGALMTYGALSVRAQETVVPSESLGSKFSNR